MHAVLRNNVESLFKAGCFKLLSGGCFKTVLDEFQI